MNVLFIQTGGTIDKEYEVGAKAYTFVIDGPAVERILSQAYPAFEYRIQSVTRKDSMDLTDEDRQLILNACQEAPEDHIIITHGTDTMAHTAEVLSSITNKVIVLTGSLRPERFYNSDASFNVGTAVGALGVVSPGVYIAMSGRIFPWDKYQKHAKTGQFIDL